MCPDLANFYEGFSDQTRSIFLGDWPSDKKAGMFHTSQNSGSHISKISISSILIDHISILLVCTTSTTSGVSSISSYYYTINIEI